MIIAMLCVYLVLLFALVHFGVIKFNLFWKVSPFLVLLLLNLGLSELKSNHPTEGGNHLTQFLRESTDAHRH